jgi:26S proteasome regulatory subunit T3
MVGSEFV